MVSVPVIKVNMMYLFYVTLSFTHMLLMSQVLLSFEEIQS